MNRTHTIIALLALVLAGCDPVVPVPAPSPAHGDEGYASAAWSWSLATHGGSVPTPQPIGDTCPNCNGKGTLGDGTIKVTCPVCNGTGKRTSEPVDVPVDEPSEPVEPSQPSAPINEPQPVEPAEPAAQIEYLEGVPMRRGLFGRWRY
jgi:hypothetical protein